jgi:hypothetical protein
MFFADDILSHRLTRGWFYAHRRVITSGHASGFKRQAMVSYAGIGAHALGKSFRFGIATDYSRGTLLVQAEARPTLGYARLP